MNIENRLPAYMGGRPLSDKPLNIVRPTFPSLQAFADRFIVALSNGEVTNQSPCVRAFEESLSKFMGVHTVTTANGQLALLLMLKAARIDSGEVIVPAFTFCATPHAVAWCGAKPVFADIDPNGSLCIDPADVEKKITPATKAIMGVCVYGIACNYDVLGDIGNRHGIPVLYDSAPAFATRIDGKPIGRYGLAQSFSFHATKAFATMEGGCVATSDATMAARMAALRNFGQVTGGDCEEPGINAKMQEVCAMIGMEQMKTIDNNVQHRIRIAKRYRDKLSAIQGISFAVVPENQEPVWLYFPVFVDPSATRITRDELANALAAENLFVRKYFDRPCHQLTCYLEANRGVRLPLTEKAAARVIALPIYNNMTDEECDLFINGIMSIIQYVRKTKGA